MGERENLVKGTYMQWSGWARRFGKGYDLVKGTCNGLALSVSLQGVAVREGIIEALSSTKGSLIVCRGWVRGYRVMVT